MSRLHKVIQQTEAQGNAEASRAIVDYVTDAVVASIEQADQCGLDGRRRGELLKEAMDLSMDLAQVRAQLAIVDSLNELVTATYNNRPI